VKARYGADEAVLRSFEKETLCFEGARALAPGAPVTLEVEDVERGRVVLEGRSLGSRKPAGAERFEIRARLVNLRRETRVWLAGALTRS
jgi:hypothetical protein